MSVKSGELEEILLRLADVSDIARQSEIIRDEVITKMNELRSDCDAAEVITAKSYWPFPTYGDLLFGVN